jgi:hypothetical protein
MANVTITGRLWRPGNHRHHHTSEPGSRIGRYDYVPGFSGTTEAIWPASVRDGARTADFLFASASDGRRGEIFTEADTAFTFDPGSDPGSLIGWYEDEDGIGDGERGLRFDAFSLADDDFLDWGDDFDPFTVTPGSARLDDVALTENDAVTVTAANTWPGRTLVFGMWLVVSGEASVLGALPTVDAARRASATAFAVYATPTDLREPRHSRMPPYWDRLEDASLVVGDLLRLGGMFDVAAGLANAKARARIQAQLLSSVVTVVQAEQGRIAPALDRVSG